MSARQCASGSRPLDDQAQQLVVADAKYLDHHREPGAKFGQIVRPNGYRFVGAGAQDFEMAIRRENPAHGGQITADTRPRAAVE